MKIEVSAVLLEQAGKFLVLKRPPVAGHLPGLWEFPGGKKKDGENWRECARRELFEETGLSAGRLTKAGEAVYPYDDRTVEIRFFYARKMQGSLTTCQQHAWLLPGEMKPRDFPAANRAIIRWLQRRASRKAP